VTNGKATNGKAANGNGKKKESSDDSDDSSEDEKPAAKTPAKPAPQKAPAKKAESSDDSDDSDEEEEVKKPQVEKSLKCVFGEFNQKNIFFCFRRQKNPNQQRLPQRKQQAVMTRMTLAKMKHQRNQQQKHP
jgi:hypothetical protein